MRRLEIDYGQNGTWEGNSAIIESICMSRIEKSPLYSPICNNMTNITSVILDGILAELAKMQQYQVRAMHTQHPVPTKAAPI
jgi:hypothetical protein